VLQNERFYKSLFTVEIDVYGTLGQASGLRDKLTRELELKYGAGRVRVEFVNVEEV